MVDVFSWLPSVDIDKITHIRKWFSEVNKPSSFMDTDTWLRPWADAKNQYLNQLFDDSLILSKPITYKISNSELAENISSEVFNNYVFYDERQMSSKQIAGKTWRETFFKKFAFPPQPIEERSALISLVDSLTLGQNIYDGDTISITIPDSGKKIKLQQGCKASKIIGQLCQEIGIYDLWEPVRLQISQIRNTCHLTGTLHLSIHPIDYITSSNNNYDWESCMLFGEGDYCRGVIEMMNSPMVVQAYLTGKEETFDFTPQVEWYNKKWREFFIVTPTMISGIKGYPYWNQDLEKMVIDWIYSLVKEKNLWPDKTWSYITEFQLGKPISSLPAETIDRIGCGPAMYDDFYGGETYQAIFAQDFNSSKYIFYSGLSECLYCGEDCGDHDASSLLCLRCDNKAYCCNCNDSYPVSEMYEINGEYYCEYCYNELNVCENCGQVLTQNDYGIGFYLAKPAAVPNSAYINPAQIWVCDNCLNDMLKPNATYHDAYRFPAHRNGLRKYYNIIYINDIEKKYFSEDGQYIIIDNDEYPIAQEDYFFEVKLEENN